MPHVWITGDCAADRAAAAATVGLAQLVPPINAHRRLRGPYTAVGTLLRAIVPDILQRWPELVHTHDIEVLATAPELRDVVPASRETLTSVAIPDERTRAYAKDRTLRIAHGVTELVRDYLSRSGGAPRMLVVDNIHHADHTDAEFLRIALRRLDPELLTLVVCTPADAGDTDLRAALRAYAEQRAAAEVAVMPNLNGDAALAAEYVDSDCTSDLPELVDGYARIDATERARLHDCRGDLLEARGERSLLLGAVPYHREHGSDPAGVGTQRMFEALEYCYDLGFYHAVVEFAARGHAIGDDRTWMLFTKHLLTALTALGRTEEAEAKCEQARARSTNERVHIQSAYALAMLYARHHPPERRDLERARAWSNTAIALASLLDRADDGDFLVVFQQNGLALIETYLGNWAAALRLVNDGIARLDRRLPADKHRLHRSVLRYNRGQVLVAMGRLADALADYTAVIVDDPNYAEYHFDRGSLLHRLGRDDEALADYAEAMRLSPPFWEVYYNRAEILQGLGKLDAALADLDYVLDLDPRNVGALVNRAGLLIAAGAPAQARQDVESGLGIEPDNAQLHCLDGQVKADAGQVAEADAAFARAVDLDVTLAAGWAGRAALAVDRGDLESAVGHLDRALDQGDDPAIRFNRAVAYRALGRLDDALTDLDRALELDPADPETVEERVRCREELVATGRTA